MTVWLLGLPVPRVCASGGGSCPAAGVAGGASRAAAGACPGVEEASAPAQAADGSVSRPHPSQ
eukprot:10096414-Heterocapsa_arctica.AAC.1